MTNTPSNTKPGYKTTEFWLSLAAVALGGVMAAGVFKMEGSTAQIVGVIESALVALGYTGARLTLKKNT